MKTGDEVYIKSRREKATRLRVVSVVDKDIQTATCAESWLSPLDYNINELCVLKPNERIVSELPEIARMTGCYVALADNRAIIISEFKLSRNGYNLWCSNNFIIGTITCPNCEDFTRQWGPDGLIVGAE